VTDPFDRSWKVLLKLGGITALLWIALPPAEIIISLLPGVEDLSTRTVTAVDWFALLQHHWFLGLRNLGLLNIAGAALYIPTILALYSVLRRDSEAYAALGAVVYFVGIAVYLAGSRAFPILYLSQQYASATTDAQRFLLAAAGQTMLAEGESRAGILIIEFSFLILSAVMLNSSVFSKVTAGAGIAGSLLMMILEIAFIPPQGVGMIVAAGAALGMMTWSFLIGGKLLQLGRLLSDPNERPERP
jgi:hypothetical protein